MSIFWSSVNPDPKRQYRFVLLIPTPADTKKTAIPEFTIKTVTKPKVSISSVPHMFLDHEFKYPGRVTWDPVSVTLVDPGGATQDMAFALMERLGLSGYKYPTTLDASKISLSKENATKSTGQVQIQQLDAEGKIVEQWTLKNAFVTSLDFGGLDYSADDLSEITVEFTYDWAELNGGSANPTNTGFGFPGAPPNLNE